MALVPFGRGKNRTDRKPKPQNRERQMPTRMSAGTAGNKMSGVGSDPKPAPPVDGGLLGHDPNYPRTGPQQQGDKV